MGWKYSCVPINGFADPVELLSGAAGKKNRLHKLIVSVGSAADIRMLASGGSLDNIGQMYLKNGIPLVIPWSGHEEDCIIGETDKAITIETMTEVAFDGYAIVSTDKATMEV